MSGNTVNVNNANRQNASRIVQLYASFAAGEVAGSGRGSTAFSGFGDHS